VLTHPAQSQEVVLFLKRKESEESGEAEEAKELRFCCAIGSVGGTAYGLACISCLRAFFKDDVLLCLSN
jgi:hypothetical protein